MHLHAYVLQKVGTCEVCKLQERQHIADVDHPSHSNLRYVKEPHHPGFGQWLGCCSGLLLVHSEKIIIIHVLCMGPMHATTISITLCMR